MTGTVYYIILKGHTTGWLSTKTGAHSPANTYICSIFNGAHKKDSYVGDDAQNKRGILSLRCPIYRGTVVDWDGMEKIWHHTFSSELRVAPEEWPILLTEKPLETKINREKAAQILFETFNSPFFYLQMQAPLSLYASGRLTGLVVDSGESVTHAVPIYQGFALANAITSVDFGGEDLTAHFMRLMAKKHTFSTDASRDMMAGTVPSSAEAQVIREVKEVLCWVTLDFEQEPEVVFNPATQRSYELPDGQILNLGNELFYVPEAIFKPHLLGIEDQGVHLAAYNAVEKSDRNLQSELYGNIILVCSIRRT